MLATTVQAIPFHTFKERIAIAKQEEKKGNRVTILDNIIYIESKDMVVDGHVERKSLDKLPTSLSNHKNNNM